MRGKPQQCRTFNCSLSVEKPTTEAAAANDFNEIDLYNDANWSEHCVRPVHRRPMSGRETEIHGQLIGTRDEVFEMWGDSLTRKILVTYRIKYTDVDGVEHTLQVWDKQTSADSRWVTLRAKEDSAR